MRLIKNILCDKAGKVMVGSSHTLDMAYAFLFACMHL